MVGKKFGHYSVIEQLGKGGMGEVYLADDTTLDRKVALKFLPEAFTSDPERMARFEREAKLLASLNHPNIAGIYGLEQADGNRFLVLEYVEGETLQARLSKGALPLEDALALCRQIAEGLEAAHEKGVIHRDLKPANVMITAEEKVKILDFGLAKAFSDDTQSIDSSQSPTLTEAMTQPGVILGTAAYMSPEQAKGKSVDKRADIWAFGCILYECLTGKRAFEGETVTETLAAVIKEEPDFNNTPGKVQALLRLCLAKDRNKRLRDIGDAMTILEGVPELTQESKSIKRPWLTWIITAIAILAVIAAVLAYYQRRKPTHINSMIFEITPPVSLAPGASFALSPDGQHLAFVAIGSDGLQQLWIRTNESNDARPLSDLESHFIPPIFWSPDSRYVVFHEGGMLKKIDIYGGPVLPLCVESRRVIGGSWNSDGVIIFGTAGGTIMRVSSDGGIASPVTKLDPAGDEELHGYPTFIDQKHFLYFCNSASQEEITGTYIGSLESDTEEQIPRKLLPLSSQAVYLSSHDSGPGYILFLRDRILMAQRFDVKSQKLIGKAMPLAEQSSYFSFYLSFFSASENGLLVYRSGQEAQVRHLTWFDRQGSPKQSLGDPGFYAGVAAVPDGSRVAVGWTKASQTGAGSDIWVYNFPEKNKLRITLGQYDCLNPVWSHDMSHIVYSSNRGGGWNLYQKHSNNPDDEERLLEPSGYRFPTSWSQDENGSFLLFNDWDVKKWASDISVLPLSDDRKHEPFLNSESNEIDGHFSYDMRWVAYTSDESGSNEIYVQEVSKTSSKIPRASGGKQCVSENGGMGARWREDGKELYYLTSGGNVMAVDITVGTTLQFGDPKPLFHAPLDLSEQSILYAYPSWDVTADGNGFFIPTPVEESSQAPFNVILNWLSRIEQ